MKVKLVKKGYAGMILLDLKVQKSVYQTKIIGPKLKGRVSDQK